ncbi:AAA family ATPase [Granulosicoccus antarcticus]|uniref:Adenylyl-sulfate kinase n=1 Tax=Granulosicoccus antarcticus IMCC3135 TaxID=1192854 RepID=A0A2Z2P1T5_9GAMM|nr:AAA family ATPase [Granulosicoccus antarcticus]ASJ76815.1 hypothetical protein IMCC3135_33875 [Granulosicoccus antarcticus IMCC3135]
MNDTLIIAMAGLPASGKSAVAAKLQRALNAVLLDKDRVRDFLFASHVDYSNEQNDLCLGVMYDVANYLLTTAAPPVVILDGRTYSKRYQVEAVKTAAKRSNAQLLIIECICSEESVKARLHNDQDVHLAKDRDFALYQRSKAAAEPIEEPKLVIETDKSSLEQCLEQALNYVNHT